MTLAPGTRLGPYEVVAPLGAGGMGEVYRARDTRLSREVAVKVLPADLSLDPERMSRFAQEARAASALNHPNIVTVYDVGQTADTSYIAMEWVDGVTVRALLASGPLPARKMLSLATQMADGLARAHEAGILHRDLKPENVMVTRDGFVKILDFGLAKFAAPADAGISTAPTQAPATQPGVVLGTVGYMSPEQTSGRTVDHRSDQFSLGAILYEMATGLRAFQGDSAIATLSAILRDEPAPIAERNPAVPAPFCWIVERCLAKDPDERFTSTRDLARDLVMVRDHATESRAPIEGGPVPRRRASFWIAAAGVLGVLLAAVAFFAGRGTAHSPFPSFHQLTYRRGTIVSARFAPDGQTIVYGAAWSGKPLHLFATRPEGPESRSLDLPDADILSISSSGEMAVSLGRHFFRTFDTTGTLARASLAGGAARPLAEDVQWADWAPDGQDLAIVRQAAGKSRLEFPVGKVLYETPGWISHPRVSPRGDLVAFIEHPDFASPLGMVAVVDRTGKFRSFPPAWTIMLGLAWRPDGGEIWFTSSERGHNRSLEAVSLSGRRRSILRVPGTLTLHDIARDGRVLLGRDTDRVGLVALAPGASRERDLSWFDQSTVRDISPDGKTLLFFEASVQDKNYAIYLGKTDGSAPARIGEGLPTSFSPDGAWALAVIPDPGPAQIRIFPTGPGEPRQLTDDSIFHAWANWLPDGKSFLFAGSEPGRGTRLYVQDLAGGGPRAITPEGVSLQWHGVSPDGRSVAAQGPDRKIALYPIAGGAARPIPGIAVGDEPIRWSGDGSSLFVYRRGSLPVRVERVDIDTGTRHLWKELSPADPDGVTNLIRIRITPDETYYAYSYQRLLSDLYLVDGLR